MSLIFKHPSGGSMYQAGAKEIPGYLEKRDIKLVVLSAREYQPKTLRENPDSSKEVTRLYVPLKDKASFSQSELVDTIRRASQASGHVIDSLSRGQDVLVTCAAGINRSGLISGMALIDMLGCSGEDAIRIVRKGRSKYALYNPLFQKILVNYASLE